MHINEGFCGEEEKWKELWSLDRVPALLPSVYVTLC